MPWTPSDRRTWILAVFSLAYLIFGAARGQMRRPGVLAVQTAGLLGFGAIALLALFLDPAVGVYVVAAGWFGHAVTTAGILRAHRLVGRVCSAEGGGVTASSVRSALEDVAALGPFFAASANPAEVVDDSWRALRELYTDPVHLADRIRLVADTLGTDDQRVAASIAFQGLAARLVSPVLATAVIHGLVPAWTPDSLHWRHAVSGPWPLWESSPTASAHEPAAVAGAVADTLVEPHLAALVAATRAAVSVSARTLWGNAASSLAAAAGVLARARPDAAQRAGWLVDALLAVGPLAGSGRFEAPWVFRRRSCCLFYQIPGGGTCGDCVLTERRRPDGGALDED